MFKYLRCFEEEGRGTAKIRTQASQQLSVPRPKLMGFFPGFLAGKVPPPPKTGCFIPKVTLFVLQYGSLKVVLAMPYLSEGTVLMLS